MMENQTKICSGKTTSFSEWRLWQGIGNRGVCCKRAGAVVVWKDKTIRYPSMCYYICPAEYRLFNGRDCPERVQCIAASGDRRVLSKNEIGSLKMEDRKVFQKLMRAVGELRKNPNRFINQL